MSFPALTIHTEHIFENYQTIVKRCAALGIAVTGVVKASDTLDKTYNQIAARMVSAGCINIADSRLASMIAMRKRGYRGELMLLRIPMLSELAELVNYVDISLQSEREVLKQTNCAAAAKGVNHKIVLMMDLGDLREGFFDEDQLLATAEYVEVDCPHLTLYGIGTNLGCYGAIVPDTTNLSHLVAIAKRVESSIGRQLDIVSGGATTTLPMVYNQTVPAGINHLRIGEGALLARDLIDIWQIDMPDLHRDCYTLEAEIVEIKYKPSYPIGQIYIDAFGYTPEYPDKGERLRAILAVGKRDFGALEAIQPIDTDIEIVGASSDHLIVDITDCAQRLSLGDTISFNCYYQAMVFLNHSPYVDKRYK